MNIGKVSSNYNIYPLKQPAKSLCNASLIRKNRMPTKSLGAALALILLLGGCKDVLNNQPKNMQDVYAPSHAGSTVLLDTDFSIDTFEQIDIKGANDSLIDAQKKANKSISYTNGVKILQKSLYETDENIVNGYIDKPVVQGIVADCWLLGAAENMSYTPGGAKILHDAIRQDENGDLKVYLKGPGLEYTVTQEELWENNQNYTLLSFGDDDMLAIEIAVQKFRQDIKDGNIEIDKSLPEYMFDTNSDTFSVLNYGETRQGYWILGGLTDTDTSGNDLDKARKLIEKFRQDPKHSMLDVELKKDIKVTDLSGQTQTLKASHAYCVREIKDNVITLISTTNSQYEIKLPLDSIYEMPIIDVVYCYIDDTTEQVPSELQQCL